MSNRQYVHIAERQTIFQGFCVPIGAIFGRTKVENKDLFWVTMNPKEVSIKNQDRMFRLWVDSVQGWKVVSAAFNGKYNPVLLAIRKKCREIDGFPVVEKWQRPVRPVITQADRDAHRLAMELSMRKVPELQQGYTRHNQDGTVRDWNAQYMVDGRGYDISWEEKVFPLENYNGLPVYYGNSNKPSMSAKCCNPGYGGQFDGLGETRRDGMKVDQTKCRPGKVYTIK